MYIFNRITVNPQLPKRIENLEIIANNLSLADFKWSPDSIPRPPEYIGSIWSKPYSAEKYAKLIDNI